MLLFVVISLAGFFQFPESWINGQFSVILGGFLICELMLLSIQFEGEDVVILPRILDWRVDHTAGSIAFIVLITIGSVVADKVAIFVQGFNASQPDPGLFREVEFLVIVAGIFVDYYIVSQEKPSSQTKSQ